jgi:AcrR family transcriptional regulator
MKRGETKQTDTKDRIAEQASVLLEAEGADAVTMRRVAAALGMTAMAAYRHYPDRDGLMNALADRGFAALTERLRAVPLAGTFDERMTRILDINLDFALERPKMFDLMFLRNRKGARQFPQDFAAGKSPTGNVFAELMTEGMASGEIAQANVWEIVFECGALLQGLVMLYLGGRMAGGEDEFRKTCHRAMGRYFHGVRQ